MKMLLVLGLSLMSFAVFSIEPDPGTCNLYVAKYKQKTDKVEIVDSISAEVSKGELKSKLEDHEVSMFFSYQNGNRPIDMRIVIYDRKVNKAIVTYGIETKDDKVEAKTVIDYQENSEQVLVSVLADCKK